jgi:hypothetical protein
MEKKKKEKTKMEKKMRKRRRHLKFQNAHSTITVKIGRLFMRH